MALALDHIEHVALLLMMFDFKVLLHSHCA